MVKKFNDRNSQLEAESAVVLTNEAKLSLYKKSQKSGISTDILEEVYRRGYHTWSEVFSGTPEQFAFDRVNSFIAGGFAVGLDEDLLDEKRGLWDNIHAKRARIKAGSGERMRKPGSKGAPTDAAIKASQNEDADPCWKNYKQVGMKMKNGKKVPNCVPVKEDDAEAHSKNPDNPSSRFIGSDELVTIYKSQTPGQIIKKVVREAINEATYKGKKVPLNKPMKGDVKKSKVFVDPDGDGIAKKVNFGDKKLSIKKHIPERKKSYCARSGGQGNLNDKTSANYWSRRAWNCEETEIDEVAMYMPPDIQPPSITRPAPQRQFSRSVTTNARMGSGAGAMRGGVQIQRAAPYRGPTARMNASQGGSMNAQIQTQRAPAPRTITTSPGMGSERAPAMTAKPTVTRGMEASKFSVQKGMSQAGREAGEKAASKIIPAAAEKAAGGVLGKVARTALGPAAGAAMAVMEPTPAGEKMSEFERQDMMKKYNPFKSQGRSIADYEKQQVTRKAASAPTAAEAPKPTANVPTPPSRPDYMSRGQAFQAARAEKGGAGGKFEYGGKEYQTNVAGEKYVPKPTTTSVKSETESGFVRKKIKEAISELSVPAGTTGRRKTISTPMVAIRMASGKIEKHPPGKSGSSGGGDE